MKRLLVTAVVALFAGPVLATNWVQLPSGPREDKVWVDTDSIRWDGDLAQAWTKLIMEHPKPGDAARILELDAFSCSANSLGTMSVVMYDAAGDVMVARKLAKVEFQEQAPETIGLAMTQFVCALRK